MRTRNLNRREPLRAKEPRATPARKRRGPPIRTASRRGGETPPRTPPAEGSSRARTELIAIQRAIVERLKREIDASVGPTPPAVQIYYEEYWREIANFEEVSSKAELVDACERAQLVYVGDYHTLRQAQETAIKLIDELLVRGRDVVVALEMVPSQHQAALDRYTRGEIGDEEFLRAIDYERVWDFHWEPYRRLLGLCRVERLRVVGINSEPADPATRVIDRDFHASRVIARETLARPDAVVLVLDGDLHVARDHLPLIVDAELRKSGASRRRVVVHQNADAIYWQLARRGLEREVDVVRIAADCFCVLSATPVVKLQSYLNWESRHEEWSPTRHPAWRRPRRGRRALAAPEEDERGSERDADHADRMHEIVRTIAGFLGLPEEGLDAFSLYTLDDLDFLDALRRSGRFSAREVARIERQVRSSESYFIPKGRIIYLADLTVHRAAEEATHFIHAVRSGLRPGLARTPRDAFYVEALSEALGFFGSRIIDQKRTCLSFEEMRDLAGAGGDGGGREERLAARRLREAAKLALAHRAAEVRMLAGCRFSPPAGVLRSGRGASAAAHLLGYLLGDKLHTALAAGRVDKSLVRDLFLDPLEPGSAEGRYRALVRILEGIGDAPSGSERF